MSDAGGVGIVFFVNGRGCTGRHVKGLGGGEDCVKGPGCAPGFFCCARGGGARAVGALGPVFFFFGPGGGGARVALAAFAPRCFCFDLAGGGGGGGWGPFPWAGSFTQPRAPPARLYTLWPLLL